MGKLYIGNSQNESVIPKKMYVQIGESARNVVKVYFGNPDGQSVLVWPNSITPSGQLMLLTSYMFTETDIVYDPDISAQRNTVFEYITVEATQPEKHSGADRNYVVKLYTKSEDGTILKDLTSHLQKVVQNEISDDGYFYNQMYRIKRWDIYNEDIYQGAKLYIYVDYVLRPGDTPFVATVGVPGQAIIEYKNQRYMDQIVYIKQISDPEAQQIIHESSDLSFPAVIQFQSNCDKDSGMLSGLSFIFDVDGSPYGYTASEYFTVTTISDYRTSAETKATERHRIEQIKPLPDGISKVNLRICVYDAYAVFESKRFVYRNLTMVNVV